MKIKRTTIKRGRIEMLPLIDTVFLLLVFFVYAMLSMVVHRGIRLDLPESTTAATDRERYVSISIDSSNRLFLDKEQVSAAELKRRLASRHQRRPDLQVYIGADRTIPYQAVIRVLDLVRQAGVNRVALETKWQEKAEET